MKVTLTEVGNPLEVKTKGLTFQVKQNDGSDWGYCTITSTGLNWKPKGKKKGKDQDIKATWEEFIDWMTENE